MVQRSSTPPGHHFPTPEKREGWMTGSELTPMMREKSGSRQLQNPTTTTASSTTTTCAIDYNNNNEDSELIGRLVIDETPFHPCPLPSLRSFSPSLASIFGFTN
ncbi:hypothetical protein niasHT_017762 [Heterodera trifolii]|uniref:Uncharacterized protein n=1 Tax=Heterodera trifolii TaxID=157864 RepID=A0ABD2LL30_9BILA